VPAPQCKNGNNRNAEQHPYSGAERKVARPGRFDHCETKDDQKSTKRRNKAERSSSFSHGIRILQKMLNGNRAGGEPVGTAEQSACFQMFLVIYLSFMLARRGEAVRTGLRIFQGE